MRAKSIYTFLLHCNACDKTAEVDAPEELMEPVKRYLAKSVRFQPDEHVIQINGRCSLCAEGGKA